MAEDNYQDGQDMMEIDFSDLNPGRRDRNRTSGKKPPDPEKLKKPLVFGGAALLIIIVIIAIAYLTGNGSSGKSVASIQARLQALEEKGSRLDAMEADVASLHQQEEALRESVSGLQSSVKTMKGTLDSVSREVALLNKKMGQRSSRGKGTVSTKKKGAMGKHPVSHVVRKGESFYSIAKKYGISVVDLCRLNNLSQKSVIRPGQKLLVAPAGKN